MEALNARTGAGHRPELEFEARLFHGGEPVAAGQNAPTAASAAEQPRVTGRFALSRNLAPGAYVLQVIVTDTLAKNGVKTASQSIDFEIEP